MITYDAAISACEKGKHRQRALELQEVMHPRGLQANVTAYSAAISACERGKQRRRSLELSEVMPSQGRQTNAISRQTRSRTTPPSGLRSDAGCRQGTAAGR